MKFDSATPVSSGASLESMPISRVGAPININKSSPGATIDGVTMVVGDRVLLYSQTTPTENGFWDFNGSAALMTRSSNILVQSGMLTSIQEGVTNSGKMYNLVTANPIVLNTTALTFRKIDRLNGYLISSTGVT